MFGKDNMFMLVQISTLEEVGWSRALPKYLDFWNLFDFIATKII
jgi:hypothetical protein